MRVLHIAGWYPNREHPKQALFIKRQIESLQPYVTFQRVIHLQVKPGKFRLQFYEFSGVSHVLCHLPTKRWFIIEVVAFLMNIYVLLKYKANRFDVLNYHIAYPNLTYWHWIHRWIKPKLLISEHWSGYHLNFGLASPPRRIQSIFRHNIPVAGVSHALLQDIRKFSQADFPSFIVPNVVDTNIFKGNPIIKRERNRFFMVANWKLPKNPFIILKAFHTYIKDYPDSKLLIGGYGQLWPEMQKTCQELEFGEHIEFLGRMDDIEIAKEMQAATAYLHCSNYETFSIVCAEALYCGCPVIASKVGGIPEYISEENGRLISKNSPDQFHHAMIDVVKNPPSVQFKRNFEPKVVGLTYWQCLNEIKG